jgi:hypothetical protein
MLSYLINTIQNFTLDTNFFDILMYSNKCEIDVVNLNAHLMLQFGLLVFLLSLVALITPNYFGLYGSFLLTIIPLFFSWLYSVLTFITIYNNSKIIFINGFK